MYFIKCILYSLIFYIYSCKKRTSTINVQNCMANSSLFLIFSARYAVQCAVRTRKVLEVMLTKRVSKMARKERSFISKFQYFVFTSYSLHRKCQRLDRTLCRGVSARPLFSGLVKWYYVFISCQSQFLENFLVCMLTDLFFFFTQAQILKFQM